MRVIVSVYEGVPYCFEFLGHAPNDELCAAFSVIKEILEISTRETVKAACMINESDGRYILQIDKTKRIDYSLFMTIEAALKRLCQDNGIDFTEENDDA